jgi:hypothetical protein
LIVLPFAAVYMLYDYYSINALLSKGREETTTPQKPIMHSTPFVIIPRLAC